MILWRKCSCYRSVQLVTTCRLSPILFVPLAFTLILQRDLSLQLLWEANSHIIQMGGAAAVAIMEDAGDSPAAERPLHVASLALYPMILSAADTVYAGTACNLGT